MELSFLRNNKKKATACNFQTMPMNCFVMSYDLMRGQIESYKYMIRSYLQFHDGRAVKKAPKKHIYTKQQNQKRQKVKRKDLFYFENVLFFPIIRSDKKKVDKALL